MTKNFNMLIDEDLRREFKVACDKKGLKMTEVLIAYIKEYIKNEEIPSS